MMANKWMKTSLICAGIYNILWGAWVILFPLKSFELTGATIPTYPQIWQCVGMIVAVYGLGYLIASTAPLKHWPIILVGLLGKIFGPIGFVFSIYQNIFPLSFGWNIIFNDLIWWPFFGLILWKVWILNKPNQEMVSISEDEFGNFEQRKKAKFINSLSGYKSANLIGTYDHNNHSNLSIVSSVFHLGASPALIGFIIRPDSARRDTLENIRSTKLFTLNHVNKDIVKQSHQTSARYGKEISEFQACGLSEETLDDFKAPFVKESHIKIAVELVREEKLPENGVHLMIGSIKSVHLPKGSLCDDGHINIFSAGTLSISGLDQYNEVLPIGRLSYAKPGKDPRWI